MEWNGERTLVVFIRRSSRRVLHLRLLVSLVTKLTPVSGTGAVTRN